MHKIIIREISQKKGCIWCKLFYASLEWRLNNSVLTFSIGSRQLGGRVFISLELSESLKTNGFKKVWSAFSCSCLFFSWRIKIGNIFLDFFAPSDAQLIGAHSWTRQIAAILRPYHHPHKTHYGCSTKRSTLRPVKSLSHLPSTVTEGLHELN